MSELIELEEPPVEPDHGMREEIRRISDSVRARRMLRSRIMVALCGVALFDRRRAAGGFVVSALQ